MRETWVWSLGWEYPLEKGKATHSSILAWRIPWTVVHGVAKSGTYLSDFHFHLAMNALWTFHLLIVHFCKFLCYSVNKFERKSASIFQGFIYIYYWPEYLFHSGAGVVVCFGFWEGFCANFLLFHPPPFLHLIPLSFLFLFSCGRGKWSKVTVDAGR